MDGLNCVHQLAFGFQGLCPDCREEYEYDPDSYWEYGDHPAGLERWHALQEEIAAHAAEHQANDAAWSQALAANPDIPF